MNPERTASGLQLAVTFPGDPTNAAAWSGTPASLLHALKSYRVDVRPVDVRPPPWVAAGLRLAVATTRLVRTDPGRPRDRLRQALESTTISTVLSASYQQRARRLLSANSADAVLQIGTEYVLAGWSRLATLEDMTAAQASRFDFSSFRPVPARTFRARSLVQRRAYESASACCTLSSWAARSLIQDYGVPEAKVHVVGVGSDMPARDVDRDWSIPCYLFVGMDWERKNGAAVLRAFERLRGEHPDAQLHLVGRHPRLDVPGVFAHGKLSRAVPEQRAVLERLFENATCLVLPSWIEPSAVVHAEALAAGLPSIGSAAGGSAQIVGPAGRIVNPADDVEILDAMRFLAIPHEAAACGEEALRRRHLFTWPAVAGRLLRALSPDQGSAALPDFLPLLP